jgi:hypothetical protein
VHAPTSETDVSEQIKIKAVNILFPMISWSACCCKNAMNGSRALYLSKKRAISGAARPSAPGTNCS